MAVMVVTSRKPDAFDSALISSKNEEEKRNERKK
jgi:hypothetical protein